MQPLVSDMVHDDPEKRPTIDDVVNRFSTIRNSLGAMKLRSRIRSQDESFGPIRDFAHVFKSIKYLLLRIPAIPTRKEPHTSK